MALDFRDKLFILEMAQTISMICPKPLDPQKLADIAGLLLIEAGMQGADEVDEVSANPEVDDQCPKDHKMPPQTHRYLHFQPTGVHGHRRYETQ